MDEFISDTFKTYHFVDVLDKIFDALGKRQVRWVIQYLYFKGATRFSELYKLFKEAFPDSEYPDKELVLFTRNWYVPSDNETFVELTSLGRHVYRWSPLLFFPIDTILENVIISGAPRISSRHKSSNPETP